MKKWLAAIAVLVIGTAVCLFLIPKGAKEASQPPVLPQEKSQAETLLQSMSLEEKIGQMFFVCVSESTIKKEDIAVYHLGGYLFFADFFRSRDKKNAAEDIASYQDQASIPMLMGVDEEGGTVVRISKYPAYRSRPFAGPQKLYQKGGLDKIRRDTAEKADLLRSLGINVNLAPVCDISQKKTDFIYPRTLGKGAKETAQYAAAVVDVLNEKKIGSALKHFPGYGGNADTHTGIATDTRPYESFVSKDFLPFEAGIGAGAPCVLVSHNIVNCMDKEKPASLSKKVHEILRNELNFDGVIMTDDLIMDGAQGYVSDNIAVAAVKAGNDLLCTGSYSDQVAAVLQAVKAGDISEQQITESALRILKWKEALGLLKQKGVQTK